MEGFSVQTTLSNPDWRAYTQAWTRRLSTRGNGWAVRIGRVLLGLLLGASVALVFLALGRGFHAKEFLAGLITAVVALALRAYLQRRNVAPDADGLVLGPVTIEFTGDGIHHHRVQSDSLTRWALLQDVTVTRKHIFLWVDRVAGHIVPVRDLPAGFTVDQAVAEIRRLAEAGGARTVGAATTGPEYPEAETEGAGDVSANFGSSLAAVGRLYTFRPLGAPDSMISEPAIFVLAAFSIGLWALLDRLAQGRPSEFFSSGLTGVSWYLVAALVVAWIAAKRCMPAARLRTTLWTIAAVAPVLIAGLWLSENYASARWSWAGALATILLCLTYAARALRAATGTSQPHAVVLGVGAAVLIGMASNSIYVSASLWLPDQPKNSMASWEQGERLLFEQSDRIDAAVAHLAGPTRPGPSAYMVGFAGVGEQRVFAGEVGLAARVISNRYGTASHTVLLVNDARDLDAHPLATVSGLRRTLREIGARMDRGRDILFLVLSSHGSEEPSISVSNGSLPLKQLTGEELAAALKDSGIRWKIIVISACHAGAFIPPLKDDGTIILTAAAADRTSFGCSNDRDLTYFGEAFFRDALPRAATLKEAFDQAANAVSARELAEHITPSKPQAFYGAAIATELAKFEPVQPATISRLNGAP
jgi:hypothetical protein